MVGARAADGGADGGPLLGRRLGESLAQALAVGVDLTDPPGLGVDQRERSHCREFELARVEDLDAQDLVAHGERGWGALGEFDLARLRALRPEG